MNRAILTYLFWATVLDVKHYPMHTAGDKPRSGFGMSWTVVDGGGDQACLT
jgi:hypothetical protein